VTVAHANKTSFGVRFPVVRCDGCGLVYANPRLTGPALSAAYALLREVEAKLFPPRPDETKPPGLVRRWWRHLTQRQVVGDWVEAGPVLDIGCDVGQLLLTLRARGIQASGIEVSPIAVQRCRARDLDVIHGTVEEVDLPDAAYRTITLSHVLEHFPDPNAVLKKLWRALEPGGRIIIAVPNHQGLIARLFGAHWHGWDPPFHLTHFDSTSLARLLETAGFQIDSLFTRSNPEDVTRSLGNLVGRRVDALWIRAAFLPTWILGPLRQGGELCVVASRPLSAN
jgi:SAM-dependent methyltransferase